MIGRLRRKFVGISMLSISTVTLIIVGIILLNNYITENRQFDSILNMIAENNGTMPEFDEKNKENFITKETKFATRYFTIKTDTDGNVTETNMEFIVSVTNEDADSISKEVLSQSKTTGFYKNYKFKVISENHGMTIIFLDCAKELNNIKKFNEKTIMIMCVGLIVVFCFASILSKKALKPIIENMEKQKRFITDAGHDLKTPIAVIKADIEVLEMTSQQENEWVTSIKNQANRLELLIKSLLNLANVDEGRQSLNFTDINNPSIENMFDGIKKNAVICIDKNKAPSIYDLANKMECVSISCRPDWRNVQYKINEEGKCLIDCSSTNNRYEYNGKCYDTCPDNTTLYNNICYSNDELCDSNCKTCYYEENIPISSNCSSCYENKYLKNGKCVDDCKSDSDYQYEFKHTCYQECPYNISVKSETKDFYCEAKCSKENPFEIIETQTCVSICSITQSESGICKINYISEDENNKEVEEKAVEYVKEELTNGYNTSNIDSGKNVVIEQKDSTITITTTENQKMINYQILQQ